MCETAGENWDGILQTDKDNSRLLDAGTSHQALTADDIVELRSQGKSGDEIVAALTANSVTYQDKTEYAQARFCIPRYLLGPKPAGGLSCRLVHGEFAGLCGAAI